MFSNCFVLFCFVRFPFVICQTIELVLVDEGKPFEGSHPMHMHGYTFQVVAMGKLGQSTTVNEVMKLDQAGKYRAILT